MTQVHAGTDDPAGSASGFAAAARTVRKLIVGGEGPGDMTVRGGTIKASILQVDAARSTSHCRTMPWPSTLVTDTSSGITFGKQKVVPTSEIAGSGMWHSYLFMETPDDHLVSLDAKTGQERWHKRGSPICNMATSSTPAPIVIGNHVLVGTGNDIDAPGFLQSFDPETGALQWKHYTVPMKKGDPGLDTWASLDAARHGGAQTWTPGAYDPETNLYIFGTGNPTPAFTTGTRGEGVNLFTCTLIALNVDTGNMAWYFQTSASRHARL